MRLLARVIIWLRWPIALAWVGGAVAAFVLLPSISDVQGGAIGALVPDDAPALDAERASVERFAVPIISRSVIVQRNPDGLSPQERLRVGRRAARLTRGTGDPVAAAIPVIPGLTEPGADALALTYLFFPGDESPFDQAEEAERIAGAVAAEEPGQMVRATGTTPARAAAVDLVEDRLRWVEIATGLVVALVVGLRFRSFGAPLVALLAVLVAYVLSTRLLAEFGPDADVTVPREVQPVIVVLVFGVVTDYSIFYLARVRARLAEGEDRREAARTAAAQLTGIVSVAAISVAAAAATLLLAGLDFLSAFGPGMAVAVLVGALVAMTLVPAVLAILGHRIFRRVIASDEETPRSRGGWVTRFAARHPVVAAVLSVLLLAAGASGLWFAELSNPVIRELPAGAEPHEGYELLRAEVAPGAVAPTAVLVEESDVGEQPAALRRFGALLERQPQVARVLGPADQPADTPLGVTVSRDGGAARFLVVLGTDPLGASGIDGLAGIRRELPDLLDAAGLGTAEASVAGDTAIAEHTIDRTVSDLALVGPAAVGAVLLVLVLYLRAFATPLAIVAAGVLGLGATLGVSVWFFQELLGQDGLAFYVPFASAVLLLSLGSDYSVFLAGRVWQAARHRGLAEAVRVAGSRAAGPISTAALVLAASFALLAIVPLQSFQQLAFTMAVGLLIDGFIVRTLLVPALIAMGAKDRREPVAG